MLELQLRKKKKVMNDDCLKKAIPWNVNRVCEFMYALGASTISITLPETEKQTPFVPVFDKDKDAGPASWASCWRCSDRRQRFALSSPGKKKRHPLGVPDRHFHSFMA